MLDRRLFLKWSATALPAVFLSRVPAKAIATTVLPKPKPSPSAQRTPHILMRNICFEPVPKSCSSLPDDALSLQAIIDKAVADKADTGISAVVGIFDGRFRLRSTVVVPEEVDFFLCDNCHFEHDQDAFQDVFVFRHGRQTAVIGSR
jgi:hypothetical protein